MNFDVNAPVIVSVAQHTWHNPDNTRTPLDALHHVASKALEAAHCAQLARYIDTVATVRFIADSNADLVSLFPRNPGRLVADRLGLESVRCVQTTIGGNTPQALVNHFAAQLASGKTEGVLIAGAESLNSLFDALRNGHDISSWQGEEAGLPETLGEEKDGLNATEQAHGLYKPINTYPLFENALRYQEGGDSQQQDSITAELCARMSAVAASNPFAWRQQAMSAESIATVSPENRYIGYPYPKKMNAVLAVDMAAAVIMTTAGKARDMGLDPSQLIYLRGGVDINDIWHISERDALHQSPAIELASQTLLAQALIPIEALDLFDIYSCFPSAVRVACKAMGISPLDPRGVTVTGGLPFFGGPGNNYSLHAIAQMVEALRNKKTGHGLVSANGLYLTKHSLGLYSTEPAHGDWQPIECGSLQQQIDAGPRRTLAAEVSGEATMESFTVSFGKAGPETGIVIASNADGERIIANTSNDPGVLERLIAERPIGLQGRVSGQNDKNLFEF